jgi:hypothetical protein
MCRTDSQVPAPGFKAAACRGVNLNAPQYNADVENALRCTSSASCICNLVVRRVDTLDQVLHSVPEEHSHS